MLEAIDCYFSCIAQSTTRYILFFLLIGALTFGIFFLFTKKPHHMFLSQIVTGLVLMEGFRQMTCPMAGLGWIYLGSISGGIVLIGIVEVAFDRYVQNLEIKDANIMGGLSSELGCRIYLLDTQKIMAFTHRRRIYLSVGLMELLEPYEVKAVAAHEMYHARHTPNRLIANILAVASLWLKSYRDDINADKFAAEHVGEEELVSALRKLKIKGYKKRIKRLAA